MKRPACILYVCKWPGGGSVGGLVELVRVLDRSRYAPKVAFYGPTRDAAKLLRLEVPVFSVSGSRPSSSTDDENVEPSERPPTSGIAPTLRRLVRRDIPRAREVEELIRVENVDLVHHNNEVISNRDSILAGWRTGVPQVCHVRGLHSYSERTADRWLDRALARRVQYFFYMSRAIADSYRSLKIPDEKGMVLDDPFDVGAATSVDRLKVLASLGLGPEHRLVTNVGRVVPWKGQDYFLRAMSKVLIRTSNVRAVIVGEPGAPAEHAFLASLHALADELRITDKVVFTGFRSDASDVMAVSEIVVHSASDPEPFGRVLVEAMIAERPVVATAGGGAVEVISHEETGLLVPLRDADSMCAAITRLLDDPGLARRMGSAGRRVVTERFGAGRHVERVQAVYESILGGSG